MYLQADKRMKKACLFFLATCTALACFANRKMPLRLESPDKRVLYEFEIRNGSPGYRVWYEGKLLVDFSVMILVFN
jgi:hypothetical protein